MAARLLVPIALLLVLSHVPASAPATFVDPLGDLVTKAGTANATSSSPAASSSSKPAAPAPSVSAHDAPPSAKEKDNGDDKAKEEEREKQRQQQKEMDEQSREFARLNRVVSPTNFMGSYKGMAREFVNAHNEARARYGAPPIKWDKKLARDARRWSNSLRGNCALTHSSTKNGESIFLSKDNWNATAKDAVHGWSTEEPIYDKVTGKCTGGRSFDACGHFALIVNKNNKWVGCGRVECIKGGVFIACNYSNRDIPETTH